MTFRKCACSVAALLLLIAAPAMAARPDANGRQFNPAASFDVNTRAVFVPVDPAGEPDRDAAVNFTGTGSATSTAGEMTLVIDDLTSDAGSVALTINNPLTYDAKRGKQYRGTGSAVVTIDSVDHAFDVEVRVKVRENRKGLFLIGDVHGKNSDGERFILKLRGKVAPPAE